MCLLKSKIVNYLNSLLYVAATTTDPCHNRCPRLPQPNAASLGGSGHRGKRDAQFLVGKLCLFLEGGNGSPGGGVRFGLGQICENIHVPYLGRLPKIVKIAHFVKTFHFPRGDFRTFPPRSPLRGDKHRRLQKQCSVFPKRIANRTQPCLPVIAGGCGPFE